jgi:hypothetical protein
MDILSFAALVPLDDGPPHFSYYPDTSLSPDPSISAECTDVSVFFFSLRVPLLTRLPDVYVVYALFLGRLHLFSVSRRPIWGALLHQRESLFFFFSHRLLLTRSTGV